MNSMEVKGEEKRGKRSRLICLYDDWIDGNSIGHDPLIYIEGGWSYPSRKPLQALFSKFSTSLEQFGSTSRRLDPNSPFY
jgi:hypothetical protein